MTSFTIELDRSGKMPLYEQLYEHITEELRAGRLREGERLPSKKALAAHLQISRNTVETAYAMLCQEGYAVSKPRSGTFAARVEPLFYSAAPAPLPPEPARPRPPYDFATNTVDAASFPFRSWAKLGKEVLYNGEELLSAGDSQGDARLRAALAKYLREFRAVDCEAGQIVIGAGMEYLLMLLCRLLPPGLSFAVEDPGYPRTASVLAGSGRELCYLPLDEEGLLPGTLARSGAQVACVTPSHQFPTGAVMPVPRRIALLKWANDGASRYVVEDDYNSEFNFAGRPIPALQGMDSRRVIYMSTFSRVLAPSIRIAYMVLPWELLAETRELLRSYSSTVSRFEQNTLAAFIEGGYLTRHLSRMKTLYRRRRDALLALLAPFVKAEGLTISGGGAGLHLLLRGEPAQIEAIKARAEAKGVRVAGMNDYRFRADGPEDTLLLGYAGMDEERLAEAVRLLFLSSEP